MTQRRARLVILTIFLGIVIASRVTAQVVAFFDFRAPLTGATVTLPTVNNYYEGLRFTVMSLNGDILGVDMATGSDGISGKFVQAWHASDNNGLYDVTSPIGTAINQSLDDGNFDSHLLSSAGSISSAFEDLGTGGTMPQLGKQLGPFLVNNSSLGYLESGPNGILKGQISNISPHTASLDVAYVVEQFGTIGYMFFAADVTTTNGTFHVTTQYVPEPASICAVPIIVIFSLFWRRSRPVLAE